MRRTFVVYGGVRHALLCSLVVLSCVSLATAAPLSYDEAIDGDLPVTGSPLPILALDVGTNTVTGNFRGALVFDTFDSFAFTVPASTQVVSAKVELTDASGDLFNTLWQLYQGSANWANGAILENISSPSPGSDVFISVPLGPDTYDIAHRAVSPGGIDDGADYVFTFVVESTLLAVPEPSTLALSVLGLMGLACGRRRQRS